MGADPNLDPAHFKKFLEEFSSAHAGTDNLPFSSLTCYMSKGEIEGECLEWVSNCLVGQNKAPYVLAAAISRATVDIVLGRDLTPFIVNDERRYGDDEDVTCTLYDAGQIFPLVWTTVNDLCDRWKTDLPEMQLPLRLHQVSQYAVKNTRKRMEDKHVIIPDMNTLFKLRNDKERSFYAVYDGHGGTDAAMYACQHLHSNAVRQDCFLDDPAKALADSFHITDEAFLKKARREGLGSGSTGVSVIIEPDKLHISWLGDSQAYLMREGLPVTLMHPHKPERPDEKQRIEQLGGCVLFFGVWRVNGTLAVSRAIGDPDQKPYVSSDADMTTVPLTGTEDCVVLACDGLWDVVEPRAVCRLIQDCINGGSERDSIAHRLVIEAKACGSNDNITVLVVFLNPTERELPPEEEEEEEAAPAAEPEVAEEEEKKEGGEKKEEEEESRRVDADGEAEPGREESGGGGGPSEEIGSENVNNNNRTRRGSDPAARRSGSGSGLVGVSLSPSSGTNKATANRRSPRAPRRQQGSSPDKPIISGGGGPKKTSGPLGRQRSLPAGQRRTGAKNTCRVRKTVKQTNRANAAANRPLDLVAPTSALVISSREIQRKDPPRPTDPPPPPALADVVVTAVAAAATSPPSSNGKSMPVSVKPKSMRPVKSPGRQLELAGLLKNKPRYQVKARLANLDAQS